MTLGELKDTIAFEGKINDIDALGGWLDVTAKEIIDGYSAQIRYDQLYVPDVVINAGLGESTLTLPTDLQHIDLDGITFRQGGDVDNDVYLMEATSLRSLHNDGYTRFVYRSSTNVLRVFPYEELTTSDQFILSYWRKPSSLLTTNDSIIVPDEVTQPLKMQLIARANMFGDGKQAVFYRSLEKDARSQSLGVTRLPGSNE